MIPTETGDRRASLKARLIECLYDPLQLRIIMIGLVLVIGYTAVYVPLGGKIAASTAALSRERKMAELAATIEHLQAQCSRFAKRVPQQADSTEWMQYMHEGIRRCPLKLTKLDCLPTKKIGPCMVIVMTIELQGSLFDLDQFLRWLESNPRLLRTDEISLALANDMENKRARNGKGKESEMNKDDMVMTLTVLGLAG